MDIQAEKIELVKMLLEVDNPAILEEIKTVLEHAKPDFYNTLPETVKTAIDRGIQNMESSDYQLNDRVIQNFKSKYGSKN